MKTIVVDGRDCELQFSREFRHTVLDLLAPDGMCFSGGEHFLTVDHRNGTRSEMEQDMISKASGEQLRECDCEDCKPPDWFKALKFGDIIEAARDITGGDAHWFADAGESLTVVSVTDPESGDRYVGVRRVRCPRGTSSSFKVGREDVQPKTKETTCE